VNVIKTFLLLILSINLYANTQLQRNYFVTDKKIYLSTIIQEPKQDYLLYTIDTNKYTKRIQTKKLLQSLKEHGYTHITSKNAYTQFTLKSPINVAKIAFEVQKMYKKAYKNITIKTLTVTPRSYLEALPKEYTIGLNKKAYLRDSGILYIKTQENKEIFFNYHINATIKVLTARVNLKKGDELSELNTQNNSIILKKFRALPLQELQASTYQAKYRMSKGALFTKRNVVPLLLIKRGDTVNVTLKDSNIAISFSALAKQNGRFGQTIVLKNLNGKKIRAVVTGKNRAEMQ